MRLTNGTDHFGLITRLIHWVMALGIIGTLALGLFLAGMEPRLSRIWLYGLHKTIGISLLALVLIRLVWHRFSPPPAPLSSAAAWQDRVARLTHGALYALMILMPLVGWIGSAATGLDVVVFSNLTLPRIAPVSEGLADAMMSLHAVLGKMLMALIGLHVAGALMRQWGHKDGTLTRMIKESRPKERA